MLDLDNQQSNDAEKTTHKQSRYHKYNEHSSFDSFRHQDSNIGTALEKDMLN